MGRGLNSYSNRRDANEADVIKVMRAHGLTVTTHDRPWDICATYKTLSRWAEVKAPRNKKNDPKGFSDKQIETLKSWPNAYIDVLVTDEETRLFCQKLKRDSLLIEAAGGTNLKRPDGGLETPAKPTTSEPIKEVLTNG